MKIIQANPRYAELFSDKHRYLPILGGRDSGKSHFAAQKLVRRCGRFPHRFLALRKTNKSARRSVFQLLDDYNRKFGLAVEKNKTDLTFEYKDTGAQIYCSGLDDPDKVHSIEGVTGIWFEEAIDFELNDFLELDPILRGEHGCYLQVIFTFNPTDPYHWLRELFFSGDNAYRRQANPVETTIDDNIFATKQDKQTLENLKEIDEPLYQIYRWGKWAILQNLIYSNWDIVDEFPVLDDLFYGMDFGSTDPCAIVECGKRENDIYLRELFYEKELTPTQMFGLTREVIPNRNALIYADSSRPEYIKELSEWFYNIKGAEKGPGSVLNGIDFVKKFKLHIHRSSINLLREIRSYKRREIRGRVIDEPAKFNDHLCDSMRYAIVEHIANFVPVYSTSSSMSYADLGIE